MTPPITAIGPGRAHLIRDDEEALAVAAALAAEFAPGAAQRDRERRLPLAELRRIRQSGLWGITVPREYGGAGVSYATLARVIALLAAADGSIGQIPQNHYFIIEIIRHEGSEQQKRFFFERVLAGDHFGNALVEPDVRRPEDRKVSLTRDAGGEGWRVSVRKFYSTGALFAEWVPVAVGDADRKHWLAIYPRDAEGLSVIDDWAAFGQRTTASGSVLVDDAYLAPHLLVPHTLNADHVKPVAPIGQVLHAAIDTGIARAAFEATIAFIRARNPLPPDAPPGTPWEEDQLSIREVGELAVALHGAEALLERAGLAIDRAWQTAAAHDWTRAAVAVSEARAASTHAALLITNKLFELAGTRSTAPEHGLDRLWRDARTHTLHDPVRWRLFDVGNYYLNGKAPLRRPKYLEQPQAASAHPVPAPAPDAQAVPAQATTAPAPVRAAAAL
ncbi:SfnB family sulfur acquisition oxidoreductase [Massilia forsythiae]|uniref:SfnB family sulfur acquisition oxidoreductase n=1 Tax=Massilia forsythiae TaxID=2728020 RepID=A0A7Z2ZTW2_9BURK|nr:SfnB family sulfur acquisition oxidoreductase [Massilia forsythiae]QJE01933.1 SfnB family sulfur acquisition oxidoreductase [Massilia forsythiae]